jgi:septum formation inhibitor MinC
VGNVFVYGLLRGLASNLANKNRIENPRGFS